MGSIDAKFKFSAISHAAGGCGTPWTILIYSYFLITWSVRTISGNILLEILF